MDRLAQDFRFALSSIRRRPLVASAIILTLGLGIGANAAIFRAFSAAFLRPLPFSNEERLARLYLSDSTRDANLSPRADVFLAVREQARSFSGLAGQRFNDFTVVIGGGDPQRLAGIEVSEGWSRILGVNPLLGRPFTAEEEQQGIAAGVVLISHGAWLSRFGGRDDVLGESLTLNGRRVTVVGVLPAGLRFPYESELWLPTRFDEQLESTWALNIVARLRDGISHEEAGKELEALSGRLPEVMAHQGMTLTAVPIREVLIDDDGPLLMAVSLAVFFLLVLVTVNVANLLVAHSLSRRREFAIRSALGAGFGRHLQQTMTEGLVLALAGGALGLLIAEASGSILSFLIPEDFSYVMEEVPFDAPVIAFTILIAIVAGCAFGAIPALRVARTDPAGALTGGERATDARGSIRTTRLLTIAQIALALVLVTGAHAMIRDFQRRVARDPGYDQKDLLTLNLVLPSERYPEAAERNAFLDRIVESVEAVPGVAGAGTVNLFPAAGQGSIMSRIEAEGVEPREDAPVIAANRMVHGALMEAMSLRVIRGRLLHEDELRRGDRVVVVSRLLARRLWSAAEPLGRRIRASRAEDAPWLEVVGVVDDLEEFYAETGYAVWAPVKLYTELPLTAQMVIVARMESGLDTEAILPPIREAIHEIDPQLAIFDVFSAEDLQTESLAGRRSARTLTGAFAILALVVATIGVYASMAFAMARRSREIAVRMALGGSRRVVAGHFLAGAAGLIAAGVALGASGAWLLARSSQGIAADLGELSLQSLALASLILGGTALVASWLPLRRATRIEPASVLRSE
ncbi:MAG TPA: ADOP family duplicated permease [Thermoanaerobaculia bacterium]|nr:ADOP family duplicated permease [Thermoanaerobaculia bacterium]